MCSVMVWSASVAMRSQVWSNFTPSNRGIRILMVSVNSSSIAVHVTREPIFFALLFPFDDVNFSFRFSRLSNDKQT